MTAMPDPFPQVRLEASGPVRFHKTVAFCCDENHLKLAGHAAGRRHDAYLRTALPSTFEQDYGRILDLNSGIFVQEGDFSALSDVDIGAHSVVVLRDHNQRRRPDRENARNGMRVQPPSVSFNTGAMLMDVTCHLVKGLLQRCVHFGCQHNAVRKRQDQSLCNAVLQGDWPEQSPIRNWQFSGPTRIFAILNNPNVLRFVGLAKPRKDRTAQFEPRFTRSYARFIKTHFPDHKLEEVKMPRLAPDIRLMTKMLFNHLLMCRWIVRHPAGFPGDLRVHQ